MSSVVSNIILIGMPGCGKTTIGKILAERLNREFIDIDAFIEKTEGTTIPEIFKKGEDHFRDIESRAVKQVAGKSKVIISTGGGVIKRHKNIEALRDNGLILFINRPIENIAGDVDTENRPLLNKDKSALYNLYEERYELYKAYCDIEIINDEPIDIVLERILNVVEK
jgi:shikimate kinase